MNSQIIMIDLIQAATLSNNQQLQKNAENSILKLRIEQPEQFFLQTATILQSVDLAPNIRQAAGTLLTVSLKFKANDKYLWQVLSHSSKTSFKDMVLGTMIDKEKLIRRAAANIVAAICCIEIPRKQWPGIAEKITANMNNDDLVVKEVSILTIGFICEQLREFNFTFDDTIQETILTGILLGVKDTHPQIAETAFKALRDGIAAVSGILTNPQYRDYLIAQIAEAINSKTMVELGLQSLIQFVRSSFGLMGQNYVEGFATLIDPILCNTADEVTCTLAMQFWATFAKEEKSIESNPNMTKFIKGPLAERLVQRLLNNLCFIEQGEEEGNGISESAASALEAIFEGDSVDFEKKVLIFTENTIKHENWRYRQGSIRAFALLLMGLPQSRSQQLVNVSLIPLVSLLNDPKQYVQLSAMNSLCLITQQTGQVILHHANFLQILKLIVEKMQVSENFLRYVCKIIDNLCIASEQSESKTLSTIADDLIKLLLEACLDPNRSSNAVNNCLTTILSLIKNSESASVAKKYIEYVLNYFPHIKGLERQKRQTFYSGFFTMAQVCLMTLRKACGDITMDQISTLYNLVVDYYKSLNDVQGDGYYVVSALAFFLPQDLRLVSDFWKYIQYGLKKINQQDIFRATISCICDFASIYRAKIADRVDYIFNELLDIFEKNLITRQLKLEVLMCFGELFLQCGQSSIKHLKRVADLLLISCDGVIHLNDQNYAQVLQETVIETFMCLYHGLNNQIRCPELGQYIKYVFEFVNITTEKTRRPKLDYVKDSMVLLSDIVSFYPNQSKVFKSAPFISDRIANLQKYNKNGSITQSIGYIRGQFHS